ncbi:acyl-CoA dehydrogenase family protein [Streptomyces sp. NPDC015242]|uniref:acyl-CoA dehydrogenase family protein n=1 Tax=Streptomyces sp. NPDC015242 TaxID=3364951 RepID=UPI0036FF32B8
MFRHRNLSGSSAAPARPPRTPTRPPTAPVRHSSRPAEAAAGGDITEPCRRAAALPAVLPTAPPTVPLAAGQVGTAGGVGEPAAQHARAREQFGRSVGTFPAVAHRCAGMPLRAGTARAAGRATAVTGDPAGLAAARLLAEGAAVRGARDCPQAPGGRGFTWESGVRPRPARAGVRTRRGGEVTESDERVAADPPTGTACMPAGLRYRSGRPGGCRGSWHSMITER